MSTPGYSFTEMVSNQANHDLIYNQLVNELECKMGFVISDSVTTEPGSPSEGDAYILPSGKTGAVWSGYGIDSIALYYSGGWQELVPVSGWHVFVKNTEKLMYYDGANWIDKTMWELVTGGISYTGTVVRMANLPQFAGTPTSGLTSGDLWWDTTDDSIKIEP